METTNTLRVETVREGSVWSWTVYRGTEIIGGGYCRTKRDALSDAAIFAKGKE